jgi:hypothetical protein
MSIETETLVPIANTAEIDLGVGRRTIGRRIKNPPPGFPSVLRINGRLYVRRADLETYKAHLIAESVASPTTAKSNTA